MTDQGTSRRRFLTGSAAAGVGVAAGFAAGYGIRGATDANADAVDANAASTDPDARADAIVPFYGERQAGITTAQQERLMFAAFDVTTADVEELKRMLGRWAAMAARMTAGQAGQRLADEAGAAAVRHRRGDGPGRALADHHRRLRAEPVRRPVRPGRPDAAGADRRSAPSPATRC